VIGSGGKKWTTAADGPGGGSGSVGERARRLSIGSTDGRLPCGRRVTPWNRRNKSFVFICMPPFAGADSKNGTAGEREARHADATGLSAQANRLRTKIRILSGAVAGSSDRGVDHHRPAAGPSGSIAIVLLAGPASLASRRTMPPAL
jgi:hypothetical protein